MIVFDVQHLSLTRGGIPVLHDITMQVREGETLVLMGPSGGGKSSLLRCLNRLEEPQQGRILLRGQDIREIPVIELRRRVGMIFQKTSPFEGTVAENIAYGPALRGETLSRERILALMEAAALDVDLIDRPASALSGGQEQRLAIARALANEPEVLLLDEPTSALDPVATHNVEAALLRLRVQMGLTMVWVSHSVEQARRVADRLLLLEAGRIVRCGDAQTLLDADSGDARVLAFAAGQSAPVGQP